MKDIKKTTKKIKARKNKIPVYILLAPVLVLFLIVLLYILLVFPRKINGKIKQDIISIFKPVDFEDNNDFLIVKLKKIPEDMAQDEFIGKIKSVYNLIPGFEIISEDQNLTIYKIYFYKGKVEYKGIKEIYFFWNNFFIGKNSVPAIEDNTITGIKKEEKEIVKIKKLYNEKNIQNKKVENKIKPKNENIPIKSSILKSGKEHPDEENYSMISIVIDDVGYNYETTYDFLDLNFPVTFSIIPGMADSKKFYEMIKKNNFEFILHIPMEPEKGAQYVEKNAVLSDMKDEEIINLVDSFIHDYPGAIGANNHMGSKVVTDKRIMNAIINELNKNNMFWLDSMTNINSTAKVVAESMNEIYFKRDVFLDNQRDYASIKKSMNKLVNEAKTNGKAIGIGHIQSKELARVLKEFYADRDNLKIKFVRLRNLK